MANIRHNIPLLSFAACALLLHGLALACGLRKRRDGWRRATGLVLRTEASCFTLSSFGLDAWSQQPRPDSPSVESTQAVIADRLRRFLAHEPACHVRIVRHAEDDRAEPSAEPSYTLTFEPWKDGPERFLPPPLALPPASTDSEQSPTGSTAGGLSSLPLLRIVGRVNPNGTGGGGECDLWLRINHVGADGVPMQEMLTRLESSWGLTPVLYPTPEAFEPCAVPRPSPGRAGLYELQFFADFAPLLAWRTRQNASLREPMTVTAALLWQLGRLPEIQRFRIGTTVEAAAKGNLPRSVGVVVTRALNYSRLPSPLRLERYVRDFNREMDRNRRRTSLSCTTLDAAAFLSPGLATPLLRYALTRASRAFGSIGVTMLKEARVFVTPIAEVGHDHGFIAIGSVSLPCTDGRPAGVGCVTVKGRRDTIAAFPALIRHAIASCDDAPPPPPPPRAL